MEERRGPLQSAHRKTLEEDSPRVRHYSILEYARFRWFKAAVVLSLLAGAAYLWHDPPLKPYGGTWLGYTLGTVGAVLILWLLYFGVRKRLIGMMKSSSAWRRIRQARLPNKQLDSRSHLDDPDAG